MMPELNSNAYIHNFNLNSLLARCQEKGWIKSQGKQRTDSTHVEAAIRHLHRLELIGETLRAALNSVAVVAPEWLRMVVSPDWFERFCRRVEDYRLPHRKDERDQMALTIGNDGHHLLNVIYTDPDTRDWLRQVPAVQVLRQVWIQQFYLDASLALHLREEKSRPPARQQICSQR